MAHSAICLNPSFHLHITTGTLNCPLVGEIFPQ